MIHVAVLDAAGDFDAMGRELIALNPEIALSPGHLTAGGWERPAGADVALVKSDAADGAELGPAMSAVKDIGIPCVVLLPAPGLYGLDLSAAIVELSFAPFTAAEIDARIRAALQRDGGAGPGNRIAAGELRIDMDRYEVTVGGRRVDLTYKEYELLRVLASNPGRVFSRESLLKEVWEYDYFGGTRTVDVHIRRVRAKTNDARNRFIETVRNVGYRFRAPGP